MSLPGLEKLELTIQNRFTYTPAPFRNNSPHPAILFMIPPPIIRVSEVRRRPAVPRFLPAWLVSLTIHALLAICLMLVHDRSGIPDGSQPSDRVLTLLARFESEDESDAAEGPTFHISRENEPSVSIAAPEETVTRQPSEQDMASVEESPPSAVASDPQEMETEEPATRAAEVVSHEGPAVIERPSTNRIAPGTTRQPNWKTQLAALTTNSSPEPSRGADNEPKSGAVNGAIFGEPNSTSFFQIQAQGNHFCYVVDCSSSMEESNAIGQARIELLASLERLDATRQFQILLYDAELHPLVRGRQDAFFATDAHRKLARQFLLGQQSGDGTLHKPALLAALRSNADVIFFLTDGATPELSARDLLELKKLNRQHKRIHVIEFGQGVKLEPNWLDDLARDHRGTHRYLNVQRMKDEG